MPESERKPKTSVWLWVLLALTFAVRLYFAWDAYLENPALIKNPDTGSYLAPAYTLMDHGVYSVDSAHLDWPAADVPPGYPTYLALVYTLFGKGSFAVIPIQIFLSVLGIYVLFATARSLWGLKSAYISAILLCFSLGAFIHSQLILRRHPVRINVHPGPGLWGQAV